MSNEIKIFGSKYMRTEKTEQELNPEPCDPDSLPYILNETKSKNWNNQLQLREMSPCL